PPPTNSPPARPPACHAGPPPRSPRSAPGSFQPVFVQSVGRADALHSAVPCHAVPCSAVLYCALPCSAVIVVPCVRAQTFRQFFKHWSSRLHQSHRASCGVCVRHVLDRTSSTDLHQGHRRPRGMSVLGRAPCCMLGSPQFFAPLMAPPRCRHVGPPDGVLAVTAGVV
ncbi:Sex-determining transformer protein 2, partial [Frankliniella fusca]